MFFNCFKHKNAGFEVLFLQNCKVYFGHIIGFGNHLPLGPGLVSLVLFEPFCNMEALNNIVILHHLHDAAVENVPPPPPRRYLPRVARIRDDPFTLPDREFKRHFRFTKQSVRRLSAMLQLQVGPRPGKPLTDLQRLCIALHHFGSKNFIRTSGNCGKVSYNAAWRAVDSVRDALVALAPRVIRLPTDAEAQETANRMEQRYGLPGFAYGVDGMIVFFDNKVKGLPRGPGLANQNSFHTRKGRYGINAMFVANDRKLIHALDVEWHGAAHDSRVWRLSLVRHLIEERPQFLLAGDSGYPISHVLMTPYSARERQGDPLKTRFNSRHSGLRTRMTENVYADLKNRWQCLKDLRCHYDNAKKTIVACAVLHNLSVMWADGFDFDDAEPERAQPLQVPVPFHEEQANPAEVRRLGQERRRQLLAVMRR